MSSPPPASSSSSPSSSSSHVPRNNAPKSASLHGVFYLGDARDRRPSDGEGWSEDELSRLLRLVVMHPVGKAQRWMVISTAMSANPLPTDDAHRAQKEKDQAELIKRNEKKAKKAEDVEMEMCYYCHGCGNRNKLEAEGCESCGTPNVTRSPNECFMQLPFLYHKYKEKVAKIDDAVILTQKVGNLFEQYPTSLGKEISQKERQDRALYGEEFCYGEWRIDEFVKLMYRFKRIYGHMPQTQNGVFWDLGSGLGKLPIVAASIHPFTTSMGVEFLRTLQQTSSDMITAWKRSPNFTGHPDATLRETNVRTICADLTAVDAWVENTTICFFHSTGFPRDQFDKVSKLAETMDLGCLMVTTTEPLRDDAKKWYLIGEDTIEFTWGKGKIFIHEKIVP